MVGHDNEALDGGDAVPLLREAADGFRKSADDGVGEEPALPPFGVARRQGAGRGEGGEVGQDGTLLHPTFHIRPRFHLFSGGVLSSFLGNPGIRPPENRQTGDVVETYERNLRKHTTFSSEHGKSG